MKMCMKETTYNYIKVYLAIISKFEYLCNIERKQQNDPKPHVNDIGLHVNLFL